MVPFSLNIKTCCLYVIWESKIKFGQKFFASPKMGTPVHLWRQLCFLFLVRPALWSHLVSENKVRVLSLNLVSILHHFTGKLLLAIFRTEDA